MHKTTEALELLKLEEEAPRRQAPLPVAMRGQPRVKTGNRCQLVFRAVDIEQLVAEDHPVRAIWEFVVDAAVKAPNIAGIGDST